MSATFTKLKSGDWGVKVIGQKPEVGRPIAIVKKSGDVEYKTVARVLWSGDGVHICALAQERASRPRGEYVCPDCEFNQDAGDMMGCPRHRGNPRG